ncbi:hypothetical protein [Enterocloster bolteae]|uniref:Uncharacterized protein n=1 Tax=Enterocloster bolteae 90B8 TaxID=997897 RepID=N9Z021_9FIRM|nr:hypothetical protein [Enterocloster bolteae]ENZ33226.1 hypothetical protein HMPREF1097_05008 [Enterocloster bolteae 90B8]
MIKKVLSIFLSLSIIALCPLTAFAMVATPSDAVKVPVASSNEVEIIQSDNVSVATSSNAFPSEEYMETDDFDILDAPALLSSGIGDLDNTIDYSGVTFVLNYHDMSGKVHRPEYKLNSDGYFSVARPADCADIMWIGFKFKKASLPSSGKYAMRVRFGCNTGVTYQDYGYELQLYSEYTNVKVEGVSSTPYFDQSSGDLYFSQTIQLSGSTYVVFAYRPTSSLNDFFPYGGYLDVNFERLSSSADVNSVAPGVGDISSSDIQQDISSNTAQQVEQGDTIIELIKNTIQTISSQLTAFWNQLAGEFTNLFTKMNQQHTEQLEADRTNTEDMIAAEESNTTNIINNNNANTDKLAYGYDSSAQDQKNDELGSKLDEYDSAESEIFDSVSGNISDFNMDDYKIEDSSLLAGIVWVSDFMQQLFVSMGLFNLPVTISLVLIFVVIMIGYYRIRS